MTVRESLLFVAGTIVALSPGSVVASAQCTGTNPITCTSSGARSRLTTQLPRSLRQPTGIPRPFHNSEYCHRYDFEYRCPPEPIESEHHRKQRRGSRLEQPWNFAGQLVEER